MMSLRCCDLTVPYLAQASHEMGLPMCQLWNNGWLMTS